jgi:glycosyltransferase involved in cell wall biosynthesis
VTRNIVIVSNTAWSIHNFRRNLIRELQKNGYSVTAVAPPDEYAPRIQETGAKYRPVPMDNRGTNPWRDLHLCWALRQVFKREQPCCVLSFTIKPNLYSAFAARSLGIPAISNVSGLGTVFITQTWITRVVRALYRAGLTAASSVFFQNTDDRDYFVQERLVSAAKTQLVPGSGIDTQRYQPIQTTDKRPFRFLMLGRILWDKGVGEYVAAAARVRQRHPECEFVLMGFLGVRNATAVSLEQVRFWESSGTLMYLPPQDDVTAEIGKADCVVLPSYREGTPKALLEAAAMGKPIITTNVPGCRQVVQDGSTGFLVRPRDALDLAEKMEQMIATPPLQREQMGLRGREKMIREFDERIVLDRYLNAVRELTSQGA